MRICYIDHYAGSPTLGMEYRPHALALRWLASGHEVTVIAGSFSHLRQRNPQVEADGELQDVDGVSFRFIRTREYEGNGIGRILSWVDFVGKGWLQSRKIARTLRPDVVIASSTYPMDTWLARRVARIAKAKLVHEVHDLWPLTPMELGVQRDSPTDVADGPRRTQRVPELVGGRFDPAKCRTIRSFAWHQDTRRAHS